MQLKHVRCHFLTDRTRRAIVLMFTPQWIVSLFIVFLATLCAWVPCVVPCVAEPGQGLYCAQGQVPGDGEYHRKGVPQDQSGNMRAAVANTSRRLPSCIVKADVFN